MTADPRTQADLDAVTDAELRKMIRPCWYGWRTKHAEEHLLCRDDHDRAIFAAGFLIGSSKGITLTTQFNPVFHDAIRVLLLMYASDEMAEARLREIMAEPGDLAQSA